MQANYHTHTPRCGHAVGSEEAYIQKAIDAHLDILGFSDHCPYDFGTTGYRSSIRMAVGELPEYVELLQKHRASYASDLSLFIGLEAEFYPKYFAKTLDILKSNEVEYLILGQHMLGNEMNDIYVGLPTEDPSVLERYCQQSMEAMQTGCFSYFAHPDLVHYLPEDRFYRKQMEKLCTCARECHVPMEINLQGIWDGRHYPRASFWEIAAAEGVDVIFGSDAHSPEKVFVPSAVAAAKNLVDQYQLHLLDKLEFKSL